MTRIPSESDVVLNMEQQADIAVCMQIAIEGFTAGGYWSYADLFRRTIAKYDWMQETPK